MYFTQQYNLFLIGISVLLIGLASCSESFRNEKAISFSQDVKPILNKHCLACHGGIKKSGEYSLLFEDEALGIAESGTRVILPGDSRNSEFIKRIIHKDPDTRMPLDAPPLSQQEISTLTRWIDQGAKWEKHWAYIPPNSSISPTKMDNKWVKNDLDYFILNQLQHHDLSPSQEANRNTLIRRLSLDLIGLPPTPKEVDTFINDTSPDAYEKLLDQLLASPHFGERWAAMWLDLARYADTKGYEKDPYRNIWRFRDWVIQAFNEDMPFDQFTIEQLAGDLLSTPTQDQLIATAFHRNTMTNTEGGTEDEEFRVAAIIDRVNTTMEVWQGTTMSCVQCHSHPYDPFRHEEYYETFAFFNNTQDADLDNEIPNLAVYPEETINEIEALFEDIQKMEPSINIDQTASIPTQIKQAIFPRLHPNFCDDFHNVQFHGGRWLSNWTFRVQAGEQGKFYFKFDNIDINGLEAISYTWSSTGSDATIECRLDSIAGTKINSLKCAATKPPGLKHLWQDKFKTQRIRISQNEKKLLSGKHDLIFEIVNTTGKIPEGIILLSEIELHYKNQKPANASLKKVRQNLIDTRKGLTYSPIMKEKSAAFARKTQVFERGNFLTKGKKVKPNVPDELPSLPKNEPANRLAFAKWLVSKENPLTARVIVNRFWEQIFGTGLVETLEDFGTQGMKPSHPELLDYLALRFMNEHKWSVKALLKEIMLSATYRQSSESTALKLEKDPYNLLLSRGARYRLSAEQIRDQALVVSGLLHDTIGGKSVMPPQPEGIWQSVYSGEKWVTPNDHSRYRRGLYTFWKRTSPYPSMMSFDSPSREVCVSRRIRTNTPLQALVTMNDPVFVEAAQALGKEMKENGKGNVDLGIKMGYKIALGKEVDKSTLTILKRLYENAKIELSQPKAIETSNPEKEPEFPMTPMTVVANAILNLDSFVMRE
ncbi:DUF1553 domain-containing protein [Saprospiraceae bacterium]|jgi:hypothetical protein|nr:DUF1553 domain-containing protein [Saprospiraceae bacterium]